MVDTGLLQITESHCRDWNILTEEQRKANFSRVNGHQLQLAPAKAKTHAETEEEGDWRKRSEETLLGIGPPLPQCSTM